MTVHPHFRQLAAYADETISEAQKARLTRHLERCPRCRRTVAQLREIGIAAREMVTPEPPPDALERILARRAASERLILPTAEPLAPSRTRRVVARVVAACLVLVAVSAALLLRTPELVADNSELRFSPERPVAGQEVRVEYRASSLLRGEPRLVLRARYRTAELKSVGPVPQTRVASLVRQGDGRFTASFRLPGSLAYAVFAVENAGGDRVDSNGERLWELVSHTPEGRPTIEGLLQKVDDLQMRDSERAAATVREMASLYPEEIRSALHLLFEDLSAAGPAGEDSVIRLNRSRYVATQQRLTGLSQPTPEQMADLVFYASRMEDTATAAQWRERLIREYPLHPSAVQQRTFVAGEGDRNGYLERLEALWNEAGAVSPQLPFSGFMAARQDGSDDELLRWGKRLEAQDSAMRWMVATSLVGRPKLRDEGMTRLRGLLRSFASPSPEDRDLVQTEQEYEDQVQRSRGRLLALLGEALTAEGDARAALDTLQRAAEISWNAPVHRSLADLRLASGDTANAVSTYARVAADPSSSPALADSVRAWTRRHFDPAGWRDAVQAAHQEMHAQVFADAVDQPVRGKARIMGPGGAERSFEELAPKGAVAFVAFWSRYCPPSLMQLGELSKLGEQLQARGVRVVTVTDEEFTPELQRTMDENDWNFPTYWDRNGELGRALNRRGTPHYFVLAGSGRIRFENRSLDEVIRQVTVLQENSAPAAASVR